MIFYFIGKCAEDRKEANQKYEEMESKNEQFKKDMIELMVMGAMASPDQKARFMSLYDCKSYNNTIISESKV